MKDMMVEDIWKGFGGIAFFRLIVIHKRTNLFIQI